MTIEISGDATTLYRIKPEDRRIIEQKQGAGGRWKYYQEFNTAKQANTALLAMAGPPAMAMAQRQRPEGSRPVQTESKPASLLAEYSALRYDYAKISEKHRRTVQDAAVDIHRREKRAVEDMFAIGRRLVEVKDLLPHGEFEKWVVVEFDYSLTFARQLMNVDRRLGSKATLCVVLGTSIIRLLAAPWVPDDAVDAVLELAQSRGKRPTILEVESVLESFKTTQSVVLGESTPPTPRMIEMQATTPAAPRGFPATVGGPLGALQSSDWETDQLPDGRWIAKAWPKKLWATDRYDEEHEALAAALRGEHSEARYRQWLDFGYLCHYSPRDPGFRTAREAAPLWMLREALEICQRRNATKGVLEALGARIRRLDRDMQIQRQRERSPGPDHISVLAGSPFDVLARGGPGGSPEPETSKLGAGADIDADYSVVEELASVPAPAGADIVEARVRETLTFDEWWAMMPKEQMSLRHWLTIFEAAKKGADYVRTLRPRLNLSVANFLVPVSRLIHEIEKELKSE